MNARECSRRREGRRLVAGWRGRMSVHLGLATGWTVPLDDRRCTEVEVAA